MPGIYDMARELGGALARTDEYQALKRASAAAEEDRDLVTVRNLLTSIEAEVEASLRAGKEPDQDVRDRYTAAAEELQAMPVFQRVVAAQANFEKVMHKVNQTVAQGIDEGAQSRIIISS
jgi:cell fate (sporulation/competence/biofilm development) regulator YlbF (YheA/YmcA/DUF963 family)